MGRRKSGYRRRKKRKWNRTSDDGSDRSFSSSSCSAEPEDVSDSQLEFSGDRLKIKRTSKCLEEASSAPESVATVREHSISSTSFNAGDTTITLDESSNTIQFRKNGSFPKMAAFSSTESQKTGSSGTCGGSKRASSSSPVRLHKRRKSEGEVTVSASMAVRPGLPHEENRGLASQGQVRQVINSPLKATISASDLGRGRTLTSFSWCCNFAPEARRVRGSLRPIVIDGSNVAMNHGNHKDFSCLGILRCAEFFQRKGHKVVAFVPQFRHKRSQSKDTYALDILQRQGILKFTPSREVGTFRCVSYDDRFIIQYAHEVGGVIVSNDNFRDLYDEQPMWRNTLRNRVLSYTWVDESYFMVPLDPLGRTGPSLDDFLRF